MANGFAQVTIDKRLFDLPRQLRANVRAAQKAVAHEMLAEGNRQLRTVNAVATETTLKLANVQRRGQDQVAHWPTPADIIERGRRPGKIPAFEDFLPILEVWARAVGFPLDKLGALAIHIKLHGFPGRFPFKKAFNVVVGFRMAGIVNAIFQRGRK